MFRGPTERFFVEVKDEDELHLKQTVTFQLIEELLACEVRIARLKPVPGARPADLVLG